MSSVAAGRWILFSLSHAFQTLRLSGISDLLCKSSILISGCSLPGIALAKPHVLLELLMFTH